MNHLEGTKTSAKCVDIASSATMEHAIDTLGFDHASIDVVFEAVAAAGTNSAVATVLKLQSSDTNGSFADLTGYVGGTSFTIPTPANTNVTEVIRFDLDLRGKKRYINVVATPQAQSGIAAVCRLSKAEQHPTTAAGKGADVAVSG